MAKTIPSELSEIQSGWDIRIQCEGCHRRYRRHRGDHGINPPDDMPATVEVECYQCESVKTHFVDYVEPEDLERELEASCALSRIF